MIKKPIGFWALLLGLLALAFALISVILMSMIYTGAHQALERDVKKSFKQSHTIEKTILKEKLLSVSHMLEALTIRSQVLNTLSCEETLKTQQVLDHLLLSTTSAQLDMLALQCTDNNRWLVADGNISLTDTLRSTLANVLLDHDWQLVSLGKEEGSNQELLAIIIAKPLKNLDFESGANKGVLYGAILLNGNTRLMTQLREATASRSVGLVWKTHQVLTSSDPEFDQQLLEGVSLQGNLHSLNDNWVFDSDLDILVANKDLKIVTLLQKQSFAELDTYYDHTLLIMSITALFASIFITLLVRGIMSPALDNVLNFVELATSGKGSVTFQPGVIKEFNYLGLVLEQMVKQLAKNEGYTVELLQATNAPVLTWDPDFRISHMNKAAERLFGMYASNVLGQPVMNLFDEQDHGDLIDAIRRATGGESVEAQEASFYESNSDEMRCISWRIAPIVYSSEVISVIARGQDITLHKKTEEALRESELRFSLFMDYLPALAFIKDINGMVVYVNRYAKDKFGAQSWLGKTAQETFPSAVAHAMLNDDRKALEDGYHYIIQAVTDPDGNRRIYQTHKFAIARPNNSPLLGGVALDITDCRYMQGTDDSGTAKTKAPPVVLTGRSR